MNGFDSQHDSLKGRWQEKRLTTINDHHPNSAGFYTRLAGATPTPAASLNDRSLHGFPGMEDDLVSTLIPPVTVVLEGRSICQRISLHKHTSYQSLAKALRQMFVEGSDAGGVSSEDNLDLSNAVPGHLVAYEDMEDDLLLAGDLNWRDFVRVAKRIRIIPVKASSRRGGAGA